MIPRRAHAAWARLDRAERIALAGLVVLLAAGVALRLALMLSYRPALLGYSDSAVYLSRANEDVLADPLRVAGYPLFLRLVHGIDASLSFTILVQHALGVATALFAYATVRRVGGPPWLALVPAAVVLLAGDQAFFEHAVLSESLYTFLTAAAVFAAARSLGGSGFAWPALAGVLLGLAATVRLAGLPIVGLVALWVLLLPAPGRLTRLTRAATVAAGAAVVLGGYLVAVHDRTGDWSFSRNGAYNFYGRAATFADCREFDPPAGTRVLCETTPVSRRPSAQAYIFNGPVTSFFGEPQVGNPPKENVEKVGRFGRAAARGQPLDWLTAAGRDFWRYVAPESQPDNPDPTPSTEDYVRERLLTAYWVEQNLANVAAYYSTSGGIYARENTFNRLRDYANATRVEGWPMAVLLVLALLAPLACRGRLRLGALLLTGVGLGLLVVPVLTINYDGRFAVPAFGFVAGAAALGAWALAGALRGRLGLLLVVAAPALAGCGDDERRLDTKEIERGIARGIERDNPSTDVVAVNCPDDVEQRKGVVFKCAVRGSKEGELAEATVTQVDDEGRVRYVVP